MSYVNYKSQRMNDAEETFFEFVFDTIENDLEPAFYYLLGTLILVVSIPIKLIRLTAWILRGEWRNR